MNARHCARLTLVFTLLFTSALAFAQARVGTLAATNITSTGATLNGIVNAGGIPTSVTFEYGTTTAYGTTVAAVPSSTSSSSNTAVSAAITGLTPGTTYHYRTVASQNGRDAYGPDVTFTTAAGSTTVVTLAATGINPSGATVNGTVNPNNLSTTVTFEYGTTVAYGTTITADQSPVTGVSVTPVTASITGLTNGVTYHYRVIASNSSGTFYGADMTFTTGNFSAPTATTGAATGITSATSTVNGVVNANGVFTNVTFEYGTTTSYGSTVSATPGTVSGATDTPVNSNLTGLLPGTTYHYRVVASNILGTTNGADMTFTTTNNAPTATTNAASGITDTGATMNGTVNANGLSTTVTFEYGPSPAYGRTLTADQSPVTGTTNTAVSAALGSLPPATTYHYRVVATNASGTVYGADMTFTTLALPTATTDAASSTSATGATLNGTVNASGDSTTVTFEYGTTVAYGTTVTADQSPVTGGVNTAVSKAITGLTAGTTYHYRVVATNSAGTVYGADRTFAAANPPTATTGAATTVGEVTATVTGTVNGQGVPTSVSFEYGLDTAYSRSISGDPATVSASGDTPVNGYITGLAPGITYHYRIVATNVNGTATGADMTFTTALPTLSIGDNAITEGDSGAAQISFPVTLSNPSTQVVTVNYATSNGTATAGSDYAATTGTLTFPVSTTAQMVYVTINGDTVPEPDETFTVTLSTPVNATISNGTATGTILQDDNVQITATVDPEGTISPAGVVEVGYGGTQTFRMAADPGYRVSDVLVDGASVGATKRYTFRNLTDHHTIHAVINANGLPVIDSLTASQIAGNAVLNITFHATAHDPDGGAIVRYAWSVSGRRVDSTVTREGTLDYRFVVPGDYTMTLRVMDEDRGWSEPASVDIHVGESTPIALPIPSMFEFAPVKEKVDLDVAVHMINIFDETAEVELQALDSAGQVLETTLRWIPPFGSLYLETDWVTVDDACSLRAVADRYVLAYADAAGYMLATKNILNTDLQRHLIVPHIAEDMDFWDTLTFLSNRDPQLLAFDLAGTSTPLCNCFSQVFDLEYFMAGEPDSASSWGAFAADARDPFTDTRTLTGFELFVKENGDGAAVMLRERGATTLFIPHIANNTDLFWTGYAFVNPGDEPVHATFSWLADDGSFVGTSELEILPGHKVKGIQGELFPESGAASWGMMEADGELVGVQLFGTLESGICGISLPHMSHANGVLPAIEHENYYWTGITITNVLDEAISVTVELVGRDGVVKGTGTETVAPLSRFKAVVADYFPDATLASGDYIRYTATGPVVAIQISGREDNRTMSALSATR